MNIRRVVMDVDMAVKRPSLIDLAQAISQCAGVEAVNITVEEIDVEIVGMDVTIEGERLDYDTLIQAIESVGAVVHSVDQIVAGDRLIERVPRVR
ncbi:DUF211 domain-containing protein [Methylobacter tundripaludum]|uniref:DUF211 domain-containing protein n=1 Tax=Methylobacter tundripaludum TaxID=173365 RepID=UPI0004DF09E8|nr:DUF211 domain-containing protein [Methylobacter tundripaludum]